MALRIFLVGVVVSLALDLPDRGATQTNSPTSPSWLDTNVIAPSAAPKFVAVAEPIVTPTDVQTVPSTPIVLDLPVFPTVPVAEVLPVASEFGQVPSVSASLILPGRIEAAYLDVIEPMIPSNDGFPAALPLIAELTPVEPAPVVTGPVVVAEPQIDVADVEKAVTPSAGILADITPVTISEPVVVIDAGLPADPDAAFTSVVGEMAHTFAADVPPTPDAAPLIATTPIPAAPAPDASDVVVVGDELLPVEPEGAQSLAAILNRDAEGLQPIPLPELAPIADAPAEFPPAETRGNRLAHAVQLTGQAMQAWASLLGQRPAVMSVQR